MAISKFDSTTGQDQQVTTITGQQVATAVGAGATVNITIDHHVAAVFKLNTVPEFESPTANATLTLVETHPDNFIVACKNGGAAAADVVVNWQRAGF